MRGFFRINPEESSAACGPVQSWTFWQARITPANVIERDRTPGPDYLTSGARVDCAILRSGTSQVQRIVRSPWTNSCKREFASLAVV
jgi:hypothetical protein